MTRLYSERELPAILLEGRDAHAEQPHGPPRRVGAQQVDGDGGDTLGGGGPLRLRAGARDRRPVVEADLDGDRATPAPVAGQPGAQLAGQAAQDRLLPGAVGDVGRERRLPRLADRLALER